MENLWNNRIKKEGSMYLKDTYVCEGSHYRMCRPVRTYV